MEAVDAGLLLPQTLVTAEAAVAQESDAAAFAQGTAEAAAATETGAVPMVQAAVPEASPQFAEAVPAEAPPPSPAAAAAGARARRQAVQVGDTLILEVNGDKHSFVTVRETG